MSAPALPAAANPPGARPGRTPQTRGGCWRGLCQGDARAPGDGALLTLLVKEKRSLGVAVDSRAVV